MSNFRSFAAAIAAHFAQMSQGELYRVDISGDDVWAAYLAAFPAGTNEIFRQRTYHDGSYDRGFIRKMGNVVRINADGQITSIWSAGALEFPYSVVAEKLHELILSKPIVNLFRIKESKVGVVRNVEDHNGEIIEWFHFNTNIPAKFVTKKVDEICGEARTTVQVFERGLTEIKRHALVTVLDLIQEGNLYRGSEFKPGVEEFLRLQNKYLESPPSQRASLLWTNYTSRASRLRNTAIGTLLVDLSADRDIEGAVKAFETMVAPFNYKRPTALITKSMVADAQKTLSDLGLESALERRLAVLGDINVNDVLWVDTQARNLMQGTKLQDLLADSITNKPLTARPIISIEDFEKDILPDAQSIEMFFSGKHQNNLMTLTAPVHSDAGQLFKWDSNFGWAYNGNITDSIKEKVKAAGGNINAKVRVSLAWFNHDDLDLHADCPDGHVCYRSKNGTVNMGYGAVRGQNGQILDVDMNAGHGTTRTPVENLSWVLPKDGYYRIAVNQFCRRETNHLGFTVELENEGKIAQFNYNRAVTDTVPVIEFTVTKQRVENLKVLSPEITGQDISTEVWGIKTEGFIKVNTITLSPNHWDGKQVGNKHWFFFLEGCKNPEPARGIFNEYLKPELDKHRKVFEILGNKTKCEVTDNQLSGLGFSSTQRDKVIVRVTDRNSTTRIYEIQF